MPRPGASLWSTGAGAGTTAKSLDGAINRTVGHVELHANTECLLVRQICAIVWPMIWKRAVAAEQQWRESVVAAGGADSLQGLNGKR